MVISGNRLGNVLREAKKEVTLSQNVKIQACKKQYGKKPKNKAAKQACIAAAKR
jgi:hypothetical protein